MATVPTRMPGENMVRPVLYKLEKTKYGSKQLEKQYEDILGPLSLFAALPSEEVAEGDEIEIQRPVTPIEESIKAPATTFTQLAKLIRRRVAAKRDLDHLTRDEQQALAAVIMGEVNCIWPDIRRQVDDPFLTSEENRELQRRITVHIVTVCEQLFHHYLEKAKVLNSRHVFTEQANISRLKAQLSLDANKFLNILAIRRYIVADIRGKLLDVEEEDQATQLISTKNHSVPLSYKKLIECSRPKQKHGLGRTMEQEIRDMDQQMAPIEPHRALEYMPHAGLMQRTLDGLEDTQGQTIQARRSLDHAPETEKAQMTGQGEPVGVSGGLLVNDRLRESSHTEDNEIIDSIGKLTRDERPIPSSPRPESLPELHENVLLQELGMEKPSSSGRPSSSQQVKLREDDESRKLPMDTTGMVEVEAAGNVAVLKEDLHRLSMYTSMREKAKDEPMKEAEDLPPLLQAVDENERGGTRRAVLQRKMREMEQERQEKEEQEKYEITKPTHPQPATVTTKLRDKSVVRTSDVRVSERVQQGQVSLELYQTVFNELTDEIDANTIKRLDSNLFRGQEVNEVYTEIMKTLPMDHHLFDNDDFVEQCADKRALLKTPLLGAANLTADRPGRVINSDLCVVDEPPWGEDKEDWCKSPLFNATFSQQNPSRPVIPKSTTNLVGDAGGPGYALGGTGQSLSDLVEGGGHGANQALMDERNTRTYASWLAWWKNNISCDDYIKFLSTQETDHLGVVFHFYDQESVTSEGGKSETDEERLAQLAKEKEKLEKLTELRKQKSQFNEGMWNVGTVTLGGLGRDPELEEEPEDVSDRPATSHSTQNIHRTHSGKVVSATPTLKASRGASANTSNTRLSKARGETVSPAILSPASIPPSPQERLESIWSSLQMPNHMRLDMAIKYSSNEYADKLLESLEAWEAAVDLVLQREGILSKLEVFERLASDPDRFFQKGQRGSSVARLEEAKKRSTLYAGLQNLEGKTRRRIQILQKKFGDGVTYEGRPYLDKMRVDCTEMLYWLQQERRQQALGEFPVTTSVQNNDLPVAQIPSINTTVQ